MEWWGHREDMPAVYELMTLIVLPSPEEISKGLLESGGLRQACGDERSPVGLYVIDLTGWWCL